MLPIALVAHSEYPKMFYLQWEDGVLSADFYNKQRASNWLRFYNIEGEVDEPDNASAGKRKNSKINGRDGRRPKRVRKTSTR